MGSNNEQEVEMEGGGALIRRRQWRRWATAAGTRPGGKGLRLFVGSAKQMVQVPAGKRLLWALCLSNMGTQYKKRGVGESVCEEEARGGCVRSVRGWGGLQTSEGPQGPRGSPQQHWPCQRMPVIRRPTAVICRLSSATQQPPSVVREGE